MNSFDTLIGAGILAGSAVINPCVAQEAQNFSKEVFLVVNSADYGEIMIPSTLSDVITNYSSLSECKLVNGNFIFILDKEPKGINTDNFWDVHNEEDTAIKNSPDCGSIKM